MPDVPRLVYWDACLFLHYLEGTPRWLPILDALLDEAGSANRLRIETSTLSITEVAFAATEKLGKSLDPAVETAIDAMWNDRSAIRLVEFNEIIAREARRLLRHAVGTGRHLKPIDAIHLATALNRRVAEFHTVEDRLKRVWNDLPFPITDPVSPRSPGG